MHLSSVYLDGKGWGETNGTALVWLMMQYSRPLKTYGFSTAYNLIERSRRSTIMYVAPLLLSHTLTLPYSITHTHINTPLPNTHFSYFIHATHQPFPLYDIFYNFFWCNSIKQCPQSLPLPPSLPPSILSWPSRVPLFLAFLPERQLLLVQL